MRPPGDTAEQLIGQMATATHGVVTRRELLAAGLSAEAVRGRVRKGVLLPEYAGVYRVGHRAPNLDASYLAAVRACGEGAVLSGRAAGHLLGLLTGRPPAAEVTAPNPRRVRGVNTRRTRNLDPADVMALRGIPVTTVARTLVDLAAVLTVDVLARACHEAGVRYRTTPRHVDAVLARRANTPGAGNLKRVMRGEAKVTLSVLERHFIALLVAAGLPLPETNRVASGRRVDCRWPAERLTVELNGYRYHGSRHAWERDHDRRREARARGDEFRSYTYEDVFEHSKLMLAELRELLARRRVA